MLRKWAVYQNVNYRNSLNLFTIATECINATVNALENTKKTLIIYYFLTDAFKKD